MATTERDYYEVLGISRDATDADVKKAFRRLARELHPDVSEAPDAEHRFREVAEAYEVLSDPERRQTYDRFGHAGLRRGGFHPTDFDLGNLSDIFAAFFGDGIFGTSASPRGSRPARGGDVAASVEITLDEVLAGATVEVPVRVAATCDRCAGNGAEPGTAPVTCETCGGAGRVQQISQSVFGQFVRASTCPRCGGAGEIVADPCERCDGAGRVLVDRSLSVEIPAGIHDGQRIRLRGEGHAGAVGGPSGDVFVQIRVRAYPGLERDGDDLVTVARVTMLDAAVGSTVRVATPAGEVEVEVPPGTQPHDVLVVDRKGVPSLRTGRPGDLRVHVDVRVPRRLTPEQREEMRRLGAGIEHDAYEDDDGFFRRLKSAFR
jgi:molecular chaperone DnaJ